ncbi:MAG: NADH-quinone oxidoreductase subunit J, partial [Deltaproteobacteria bacterium]|nr:NADH-quinone oxidoreductase subunit J [Deltaproteobacteria bacterium]
MEAILFYVFAAVMVISSLMVVFRKNPVHSALFLVLTFFCLGGVYLLLNAQFIAAVQVIVYAGA